MPVVVHRQVKDTQRSVAARSQQGRRPGFAWPPGWQDPWRALSAPACHDVRVEAAFPLIIFVILGVALILLLRSMRHQFGKIDFDQDGKDDIERMFGPRNDPR